MNALNLLESIQQLLNEKNLNLLAMIDEKAGDQLSC